jgi:hypothetical protein
VKWIGAAVLALTIAIGGWFGYSAWADRRDPAVAGPPPNAALPSQAAGNAARAPGEGEVIAVADSATIVTKGVTPMAQRSAVIGLLNKRNGDSRDLTLKPGQALRIGNAVVRLRACERTGPWEPEQYTGAFVQLDVQEPDRRWRRAFSGWLYKERPALNVVQHPVYDVWVKSCTMSFPDGGVDAVPTPAGKAAAKASGRSSASNTPDREGTPVTSPPTDGPSAALSNAI